MKKFTVNDFRQAVLSSAQEGIVVNIPALKRLNDDDLLNKDFTRDEDIRTCHVLRAIEVLQRSCTVHIPPEIVRVLPNNTVESLLDTMNRYVREASSL